MPSGSLPQALLLLAAACGGAVWLVAFGLAKRGVGATSRAAPAIAVAWRLVPLALIAALAGDRPIGQVALLVCVGLAGAQALFSALDAEDRAGPVAAAQVSAIALAALWGGRFGPEGGAGRAYGFGVAAAAVLLVTFLGLLPPRWRPAGTLVAAFGLALAAWGLSAGIPGAAELWRPVAAGCATAAAAALAISVATAPDAELPAPLCFLLALLGGAAVLLIGRLYGMPGAALAAIGVLPLVVFPAPGAAGLAAWLAALLAGRALLQWSLGEAPGALDVTQPYAFAALAAGLALAGAPAVAAPHAHGRLATRAIAVAALLLVPLIALGVQPAVLPALLMGLLGGGIVVAGLHPRGLAALPGLIAYAGAVTALLAPRLAALGALPTKWRLAALLAAVVAVGLAAASVALVRPRAGGSAMEETPESAQAEAPFPVS